MDEVEIGFTWANDKLVASVTEIQSAATLDEYFIALFLSLEVEFKRHHNIYRTMSRSPVHTVEATFPQTDRTDLLLASSDET